MQHLLVSTRATPLRRKSTLPAQQALTLLREKPAVQFSCRTSRATFPLAACKKYSHLTSPCSADWKHSSLSKLLVAPLSHLCQLQDNVYKAITRQCPSCWVQAWQFLLAIYSHQYFSGASSAAAAKAKIQRHHMLPTLRSCWASSTAIMPDVHAWPPRL